MNMVLEYELITRQQERLRDGERRLRRLFGDVQTLPAVADTLPTPGYEIIKPGSWLTALRRS